MAIFSLLEMSAKLLAIEADLAEAAPKIVETACQMIAGQARGVLGSYTYNWTPLKPETIAHKATGDSPLLETGRLRDSIEWTSDGAVGYVGTNDPNAKYLEFGTSRMPPRPFLLPSATELEPEIQKMASRVVRAAFAGHGKFSSELHLMLWIIEQFKHLIHEFDSVGKSNGKRS